MTPVDQTRPNAMGHPHSVQYFCTTLRQSHDTCRKPSSFTTCPMSNTLIAFAMLDPSLGIRTSALFLWCWDYKVPYGNSVSCLSVHSIFRLFISNGMEALKGFRHCKANLWIMQQNIWPLLEAGKTYPSREQYTSTKTYGNIKVMTFKSSLAYRFWPNTMLVVDCDGKKPNFGTKSSLINKTLDPLLFYNVLDLGANMRNNPRQEIA